LNQFLRFGGIIEDGASPQATTDMNASKTKPPESTRAHVLVIEDNRDFARLFGDMLEIMGCSRDIAFDARSGFDALRQRRPNLIFCDLGLPGSMDGFEFARALRSDPDLEPIPLIGVSGRTSSEDVQQALDAGFDRLFPKPVKFADVSGALSTYSKGNRQGN